MTGGLTTEGRSQLSVLVVVADNTSDPTGEVGKCSSGRSVASVAPLSQLMSQKASFTKTT